MTPVSPATESFVEETIDMLSKVNMVLKAVTNNGEVVLAEAAIPGLAQIVANIKLFEDAATFATAVVPFVEGLMHFFGKLKVAGSGPFILAPATTEQLDAIDAEKDAL